MEMAPIDENTTRIFMIRHGEVENHDRGVFNGQFDVDITPRGVEHMERAAEFLATGGGGGGGGRGARRASAASTPATSSGRSGAQRSSPSGSG